jgi:hypothetical protein
MTMGDTTSIRGACGHDWTTFGGYARARLGRDGLDDAADGGLQVAVCETCMGGLTDTIRISALIYQLMAGDDEPRRSCRNWWPPRGRR